MSMTDAARVTRAVAAMLSSTLRAGEAKTVSSPAREIAVTAHRLWMRSDEVESLRYEYQNERTYATAEGGKGEGEGKAGGDGGGVAAGQARRRTEQLLELMQSDC